MVFRSSAFQPRPLALAYGKKRTKENAITISIKLKMDKSNKKSWLQITGALLILTGVTSIFPENDTCLHTALQIIFVLGCLVFIIGGYCSIKHKSPF